MLMIRVYCLHALCCLYMHMFRNKETALHLAAKNGKATTVSLLMTFGALIEKDQSEKTFFDYAIELRDFEVAMAVVKHEKYV